MILLFTGVYYLITKHRLIVCSDNYVGYTGCIGYVGCIGYDKYVDCAATLALVVL